MKYRSELELNDAVEEAFDEIVNAVPTPPYEGDAVTLSFRDYVEFRAAVDAAKEVTLEIMRANEHANRKLAEASRDDWEGGQPDN